MMTVLTGSGLAFAVGTRLTVSGAIFGQTRTSLFESRLLISDSFSRILNACLRRGPSFRGGVVGLIRVLHPVT